MPTSDDIHAVAKRLSASITENRGNIAIGSEDGVIYVYLHPEDGPLPEIPESFEGHRLAILMGYNIKQATAPERGPDWSGMINGYRSAYPNAGEVLSGRDGEIASGEQTAEVLPARTPDPEPAVGDPPRRTRGAKRGSRLPKSGSTPSASSETRLEGRSIG